MFIDMKNKKAYRPWVRWVFHLPLPVRRVLVTALALVVVVPLALVCTVGNDMVKLVKDVRLFLRETWK